MKAIILGSTTCPYCVNAKRLAEEQKIPYEYLIIVKDEKEIGENEKDTKITMEKAFEIVGQPFRTVPQIIIDSKHIGGFDDFNKFVKDLNNKDINSKDFDDMEL